MLIRGEGADRIVITQPAHAALTGQLARAWGNLAFGAVVPREDVCAGAELHDIGWLDWEQAPTLNEVTKLPHTFTQLTTSTHVEIWGAASARALTFGRYPALLASLHGAGLYAFHDYSRDTEDEARAAHAFLAREAAFQEAMMQSLRDDPEMAPHATDDALRRNRRLVAVWDAMSLALCHGLREPRVFAAVPAADGVVDVSLAPHGDRVVVSPWPFTLDTVDVHVDGRRLVGTFTDQATLRDALAAAPWLTIAMKLRPR
jgi:hypothetical protein